MSACAEKDSGALQSEPKPEQLAARYDQGLDLVLLYSNFDDWYEDFSLKIIVLKQDLTWQAVFDYSGIYWNHSSNIYCHASREQTDLPVITEINGEPEKNFLTRRVWKRPFYKKGWKNFLMKGNMVVANLTELKLLYVGSITP